MLPRNRVQLAEASTLAKAFVSADSSAMTSVLILVTALQLKCDPVSLTSRIQTDPFRTKTLSVLQAKLVSSK